MCASLQLTSLPTLEQSEPSPEAERLAHGYLFNPAFATETSLIDPLPHQRIAVYEHMLAQSRLRFLLADDAGAGKTIMAGLYIREMLTRRLLRRVIIVPPAGLIGNWESELRKLFGLRFKIVTGADARNSNPFAGSEGDLIIVSVDTLAGSVCCPAPRTRCRPVRPRGLRRGPQAVCPFGYRPHVPAH